ncbi:MAG: FAD-dependent oxidoreductase [Patescibacteria group bacterium]|nr:FAD-dependent oxidoreductase [Patescibacteria group bacterium]
MEKKNHYDLLVVGSGAAGLSAAIYAGRYKMRTLVIGAEFGGETATAGLIENYPGFKEIDGYELMKKMKEQAEATGAEVREGRIVEIKKEKEYFKLKTEKGEEFEATTVILALGTNRRHLNIPNEKELTGKGVHYCITCDGPVYNGKTVAMVGGGDSSVKGVNFLADYASKIYFIVMEKELGAEPTNLERMKKLGDKVEVLYETQVKEIKGKDFLKELVLTHPVNGSNILKVDGLFIEIGFDPDVKFAKALGAKIDESGYMKVDFMMRSSIPGLYGAGDAVNMFGTFKQDITAAATGSVAATSAYEYFKERE